MWRPAWVVDSRRRGRGRTELRYKLTLAGGGGVLEHLPAGNLTRAGTFPRRVSNGSRSISFYDLVPLPPVREHRPRPG